MGERVPGEDGGPGSLAPLAPLCGMLQEMVDEIVEVAPIPVADDTAVEFRLEPLDVIGDDERAGG